MNLTYRAVACACVVAIGPASAATIQLGADKDTMIFQNNINNGAGGAPGFNAGTNSQPSIRRSLVAFDVSQIPTSARITDVQLRLVIGDVAGSGGGGGGGGGGGVQNPTIGLHKLLVNWGEASTGVSTATTLSGIGQGNPAQTGDATWNSRFFDSAAPVLWSQPGGQVGVDYAAAPSASLVQGNAVGGASLWLSTPALVGDVQGWLSSPSSNAGWMLINANETVAQTSRGFYSRNYNPNPTIPNLASFLPQLIVTYAVPEPSSMALFSLGICVLVSRRCLRRRRNSF